MAYLQLMTFHTTENEIDNPPVEKSREEKNVIATVAKFDLTILTEYRAHQTETSRTRSDSTLLLYEGSLWLSNWDRTGVLWLLFLQPASPAS